jgi:hypothetical protein
MRLVALILFMPLAIVFAGLIWFASMWTRHQEHQRQESEAEEVLDS